MNTELPQKQLRKVPWWLKAFIYWHLYAMIAWSLPAPPDAIRSGEIKPSMGSVLSYPIDWLMMVNWQIKIYHYSPLRWYMVSTGLWQYWDMFAPDPTDLDIWIDSEVTFQDGKKVIQPYPRMRSLSLGERFLAERFRKYVDRVNEPKNEWKRQALAQWLALQAAKDPKNLPDKVVIRRHYRNIIRRMEITPPNETTNIMGVFSVDQDQIKEAKGW